MEALKNNYDQYLNWLAGADHSISDADLVEIRAYLFGAEADEIQKAAATALGATP